LAFVLDSFYKQAKDSFMGTTPKVSDQSALRDFQQSLKRVLEEKN